MSNYQDSETEKDPRPLTGSFPQCQQHGAKSKLNTRSWLQGPNLLVQQEARIPTGAWSLYSAAQKHL